MSVKLPIYLDSHATTAVDPAVLEVMLPYFSKNFGNAASLNHEFGWTAEAAVEKARRQIAKMIGATESEIIFTSGATESNNLAILGLAQKAPIDRKHILVSAIEHKAVLDVADSLSKKGFSIEQIPVDTFGLVDPLVVAKLIRPDTLLVSVMAANNEIGTLNPISEIGKICHDRGVIFHTDAAQAFGKIPIHVQSMNLDLVSLSAHKIYGPKGVGALYVRRKQPRVTLEPQIFGGGHERGLRSGTLNVPSIVGFGKAAELAQKCMSQDSERVGKLRDWLWDGINAGLSDVSFNGHPSLRLWNNLNVSFGFVEGESLMMSIKEIAVSSGSACTSALLEPSYVLRAVGLSEDRARSSIRFGLGRFTTLEEIEYTIERVVASVKKLRELSPVYQQKLAGALGPELDFSKDEFTGVEQ